MSLLSAPKEVQSSALQMHIHRAARHLSRTVYGPGTCVRRGGTVWCCLSCHCTSVHALVAQQVASSLPCLYDQRRCCHRIHHACHAGNCLHSGIVPQRCTMQARNLGGHCPEWSRALTQLHPTVTKGPFDYCAFHVWFDILVCVIPPSSPTCCRARPVLVLSFRGGERGCWAVA